MSGKTHSHVSIRTGSARVATLRMWLEPSATPNGGTLRIQVRPVRGITPEKDRYFSSLDDLQDWIAEQVGLLGPQEKT